MASQIAAQLYTLREFCKTPTDIASTFAKVRKIGYEAVQLSALGPIDPKELAGILKNEGLRVAATHTGMDRLRDQTQAVIDEHRLWGCDLVAIGGWGFGEVPKDGAAAWSQFARDYSAIAAKFAGSGVKVGYHNHHHEFIKFGGKTIMQILLDQLSPDVWFEIDTYWVTAGGGEPTDWIRKLNGRLPAIHLKDMGINPQKQQVMREVGEGNLNFPGILQAARAAGTEWFIVEQDNCNGLDPFDCLATSLRNLRALGLN